MKSLVLAEKPSVGRDIARVLNCKNKKNGFYEGEKYIVSWALGHLVELESPDFYDKKYEKWELNDLPIIPNKMNIRVIPKTAKQYSVVKKQMLRKDVNEIIIATDAGREGELVARWIIEKSKVNKKIKRLWISSVTDKAIKKGFSDLKDGKKYVDLFLSASARAEADWLVGINATRALTCKYNAKLSCGRVQTPTLYLVEKRDRKIQLFRPKKYYKLYARINNSSFALEDNGNSRFFDKKEIDNIANTIKNKPAKILKVNIKDKNIKAPQLFDLTSLQYEADKLFNFSAKETLRIMQNLYERHKIVTYPRTDSKHLTEDMKDTIYERVSACQTGEYKKYAYSIIRNKRKLEKSIYNNKKVSDHHAIVPTEQAAVLSDLTSGERKIYDLIVKRFLANFMENEIVSTLDIKADIDGKTFLYKQDKIVLLGWQELYNKSANEEKNEIKFIENNNYNIDYLQIKEGLTEPPKHYTEGSLLKAMENPTNELDDQDKEIKSLLKETGGLGTVATRADIIEKLINSGSISKQGNSLKITSKGIQLLDLVPEELKSPTLTAEWEMSLKQIAENKIDKNIFIGNTKDYTREVVSLISESDKKYKHDNMTKIKCPNCGKFLLEISDKRGKKLVCQDRECNYKKNLSTVTNARCPECHKKMVLKGEGDKKYFACICGYRESIKAFDKRKSKVKNQMNKREVSKFIKKQKEEVNENPFAALGGFKID